MSATHSNKLSDSPTNSQSSVNLSQRETIFSFMAGIGSGAASSVVCAPLDLIRTRMQVMGDLKLISKHPAMSSSIYVALKNTIATDGVRGCFRGLGVTLLNVPTFWGLYFPLYETLKADIFHYYIFNWQQETSAQNFLDDHHTNVRRMPAVVHMTSAILAGAVADFFCNPMFVIRTRMQTEMLHMMEKPLHDQKQQGIVKTVKGLYIEGGHSISIFWRGYLASLLGLSHCAVQFPLYEWLKAEARHRSPTNEETTFDLLLASASSKMVATSLTYPHEVIRSRLMDYRDHKPNNKKTKINGILSTLRRVVKKEGYRGLYKGMHVSLMRVVPNCCVTFVTYEMILRWAKQQDKF